MDSDHDDHDHDDLEEGSDGQKALTGFLFGNIDNKGELEDDILDEVRKFTY